MSRISPLVVALALVAAGAPQLAAQGAPATHRIMPSPSTVAWGFYDAAATPAVTVNSGDPLIVGALLTRSPTRLEGAGVAPAAVEQALPDVYANVTNKGPGGHILTGPIFVTGADSGDVLEVRIEAIDLAIPYAYNAFGATSGFLPEDFGYARMRIIPLDAAAGVARFAPGI